MSARKTAPITELVDLANTMLAADGSTPEGRVAVAIFIERILMDARAYKGYRYLRSEYLPTDQQTDGRVLRDGYDETRRSYFGGSVTR